MRGLHGIGLITVHLLIAKDIAKKNLSKINFGAKVSVLHGKDLTRTLLVHVKDIVKKDLIEIMLLSMDHAIVKDLHGKDLIRILLLNIIDSAGI